MVRKKEAPLLKRAVKTQTNLSLKRTDLAKTRTTLSKERTHFSEERTVWANEQTTLAYLRTGFAAFLLGIGLIKLFENSQEAFYGGLASIGFGALLILLGVIWYPIRRRKIARLRY